MSVPIFQVTNIEYDEHKGRIAIGRLHAGVLRKGMEVKVRNGYLHIDISLLSL